MGRNVTAKPGRYHVATTPYMREPQEAFTDDAVQTVVLYMAKRLGKTECINNLHGSQMEQNPRNILHVLPTLDSGKKFSKQFLMPMVRSTPILRDLIRDARSRDANNTILAKEFPGGTISIIGANSPSGFRQVQAPVVTCDEIDAMEDGPEGDPVTLAFGRAENYPDSIQVVSSTATRLFRKPGAETEKQESTGSRIHDWWLKSDQRKWFTECPICLHRHVLEWVNMKWPEPHQHELAWYECPSCHEHWTDGQRLAAVMAGEWRATAAFRGIRGYWLNGLNTTFATKKGYKNKLHQFASEFYDAYTSGESARISWKNTFLCDPHIEETEKIEARPLYERGEDYSPEAIPADILVIGIVFDVQDDRLEYEIIGAGEYEETWGIEYGKLQGDPKRADVWALARQHIARTFRRRDGVEMRLDFVACDHRHHGRMVRLFLRGCGCPRAYPVYGAHWQQPTLYARHHNKKYGNLYSINTDKAKDLIFSRLKVKEPGASYMHFPQKHGYEKKTDGYFEGLTAEEAKVKYLRGQPTREYVKVRLRNEPLDIRVYFLGAMDILNPGLKFIRSELKKKATNEAKDYEIKTVRIDQPSGGNSPAEIGKDSTPGPEPLLERDSRKAANTAPKKRKRFSMRLNQF